MYALRKKGSYSEGQHDPLRLLEGRDGAIGEKKKKDSVELTGSEAKMAALAHCCPKIAAKGGEGRKLGAGEKKKKRREA